MAKSIEAYLDNRGQIHTSTTSATIGDITYALGRVGDEGGLTEGVARLIFEKREEIEQAFADHDALEKEVATSLRLDDGDSAEILNIENERPVQRRSG